MPKDMKCYISQCLLFMFIQYIITYTYKTLNHSKMLLEEVMIPRQKKYPAESLPKSNEICNWQNDRYINIALNHFQRI